MAIVISGVNNNDKITAVDGVIDSISGFNLAGIITASSFTGDLTGDVTGNISGNNGVFGDFVSVGSNIQLGQAGILTATTFVGNLTGNVNATSNLLLQIGGSEKFRVASSGQLGIGGANYGTSGQVLTSGGSGSAATWSTISVGGGTGIDFNDDVKIRLGTGNDLEIYHAAGADSIIHHTATSGSTLRLRSRGFTFKNQANSATIATLNEGDACKLFFNGGQKFETTNTGAVVTGICTATSFSGSGEGLTRTTPLSHRNRIINGDMQVSQRVGGTETTITNGTLHYILDRFTHYESTDGSATVTQVTSGYVASHTGSGKAMRIKTTGADTSLSGSQQLMFFQYIEGYNWEDMRFGTANAKSFTVSFSILASGASSGNVTGTYCVNATNAPNFNRSYVKEYTIDAVDTWKRVSLTFPGDTSGSWDTGNGAAIRIGWSFAGPTSQQAAANQWHGSYVGSSSNQKNGMANVNNFYFITDIQVEEGTVATPFERRNYADELVRCQRYYQKLSGAALTYYGVGNVDGATMAQILVNFITEMRSAPSTMETSGTASDYSIRMNSNATGSSVPTLSNRTKKNALVIFYASGHGFTNGQACFGRAANNTNGFLAFSAEL